MISLTTYTRLVCG